MDYTIRRATIADLPRLQPLFYNTISIKSYSKVELKVWIRDTNQLGLPFASLNAQ